MIVWVGLLLATNQKMSDGGGQPPLPPSENPAGKAVPPSENPAGKAVPPPENLAGKAPASPARGRGRPTGSVGPMRRALETAARQSEGGDAERPDEAIDDDMMQDLLTTILHQRGGQNRATNDDSEKGRRGQLLQMLKESREIPDALTLYDLNSLLTAEGWAGVILSSNFKPEDFLNSGSVIGAFRATLETLERPSVNLIFRFKLFGITVLKICDLDVEVGEAFQLLDNLIALSGHEIKGLRFGALREHLPYDLAQREVYGRDTLARLGVSKAIQAVSLRRLTSRDPGPKPAQPTAERTEERGRGRWQRGRGRGRG